jgi:hypothetical protein
MKSFTLILAVAAIAAVGHAGVRHQPPEHRALAAQQSTPSAAPQKPEGEVDRITVDELKAKFAKKEPVFIIDSRGPGSYDSSEIKIKGAVRIPMDQVESRLSEIPRDKEIVVYCT